MSEGVPRDRQPSLGGWPDSNKAIAVIRLLRHRFGLLEWRDTKRFVSSRFVK